MGLVSAISTVEKSLAIGIATAQVGSFGSAAIAGSGTASRLEYLLMQLEFGFGGPHTRDARRVDRSGALGRLTEAIGVAMSISSCALALG